MSYNAWDEEGRLTCPFVWAGYSPIFRLVLRETVIEELQDAVLER